MQSLATHCPKPLQVSCTIDQHQIRLTFSQPMAREEPARVQPSLAGRWEWRDSHHLTFWPREPLARGACCTVSLPAGTRALTGAVLEQDFQARFGPRLLSLAPVPPGFLGRQPTLVARFDQSVEPRQVLPLIRLRGGRRSYALEQLKRRSDTEVVFRPLTLLPPNTLFQLDFPGGRLAYRTYPPLKALKGHYPPDLDQPLVIPFSTSLDADAFQSDWVRVIPPIPDLRCNLQHTRLLLEGQRLPAVAYRVEIAAQLRDIWGQCLGHPLTRSFRPGRVPTHLSLPQPTPDPQHRLPVDTRGHARLVCELYEAGSRVRSWTVPVANPTRLERLWLTLGPGWPGRLLKVRAGRRHLQTRLDPGGP